MINKVEIKFLKNLLNQQYAREVFDKTWSMNTGTEITSNLLQAMVHGGAYLSGAFFEKNSF